MNLSGDNGSLRRITVLQSVRRPTPETNPYFPLLESSLPSNIKTLHFSWKRALFGRYDVLHLHWPDGLMSGTSWTVSIVKKCLTIVLLVRITLSRKSLVRTIHNVKPHDGQSYLDRALTYWFDRQTTEWITLNEFTPPPLQKQPTLIKHGHYRDWFSHKQGASSKTTKLGTEILYFGIIKKYKNVHTLIRVFRELEIEDARLVVVGLPVSDPIRAEIEELSQQDSRVTTHLRYADDIELETFIRRAEIVVLPYAELHNSGAALLALSLDCSILVPANEISKSMQHEVGASWVKLYDAPLSAKTIAKAVAEVRCSRAAGRHRPNLSARSWQEIGARHAQVYASAAARRM